MKEKYYSLYDLADTLGVSMSLIYKDSHKGLIEFSKIGNKPNSSIRLTQEQFDKYILLKIGKSVESQKKVKLKPINQ